MENREDGRLRSLLEELPNSLFRAKISAQHQWKVRMTDCHFPGQFLNGERADLVSKSLSLSDAESTSVCIPILNTTEVTNAGLRFSGEKSYVKNTDNQTTYPKKRRA